MTEQAAGLLGSTILVPESGKYLHNQRLGLVVFDKELFNKDFLFHLFNNSKIRHQIHIKATGTKVRHTSPTKIQDIETPIPPIQLQNKFASIVRNVEALKQSMLAQSEELDANFNALMQGAFV